MRYLQKLRQPKWWVLSLVLVLTLIWVGVGRTSTREAVIKVDAIAPLDTDTNQYFQVRQSAPQLPAAGTSIQVHADQYDIPLSPDGPSEYAKPAVSLSRGERIQFELDAPEAGRYRFAVDQMDLGANILPNTLAVRVNGVFQFEESRVIPLPTRWVFDRETFATDRYGHEILPNSIKVRSMKTTFFHDGTALNAQPLTFKLEAGINTIEIELLRGQAMLGTFTASTPESPPSYATYLATHEGVPRGQDTLIIGAESFTSKSNPSTRLRSERDPGFTAYDSRYLRLNTIDGWSFRHGNDTVYFKVEVEETGLYHLGFNYRQNYLMQMPVFRELTINGSVPFEEAAMVPFHFTNRFERKLIGDDEPFLFHLEAGTHEIGLRVVVEPYRNAYENILTMMDEITELSLEIKRLTGNTVDRFRTWRLVQFIPDIEPRLTRWIEALEDINTELEQYSQHHEPGELTNIRLAIRQLETLRSDINDIPNRMLMLADGDASTAQLLGSTAQVLLENGLDLEALFVTGEDRAPRPSSNIVVRTFETVRRFFLSFTAHDYAAGRAEEDVIEVWANYPRQYVEIMQQIIDNDFTAATGIRVRLSLMPDESKLILASAADRAPDIALGVNHWIPYEFAIRGASLDLRQFSGYADTVAQFAPGVMIPYAFEDGMFGLPLTQNFWVTFYRSDIFEALDLPVPDTWDDVVEILPELQRLGMNFFHPIAFHGGFKPFVATLPFLHQFGGSLYAEDGMSTVINSEANLEGIRLMTELFTLYNLPKQVPNFYNHFRFGTLPIGISDLATYLQLTIAAPEIAGKWNIALHPGVLQEDGSVRRYAASGAQSSMILSTTTRPDDSWAFLEWWMSTAVQVDFALRLQTTYGTEFLWNTANLEAFAQLPLPPEHIEVILNQWDYAIEASRIPGAYMVEREISNAWNRIVFEDANPRITLDRAVRIANREILFRMEEFGYVEDGAILRPYRVPTIETIDAWLKEHGHD